MNAKRGQRCQFELLDVSFSEDERLIVLGFNGRTFRIKPKKIMTGSSFMPWVVSSSDVRDAFGESYFQGLTAFVARLAERCYTMRVPLPLQRIELRDVEIAVEAGPDSLNELVSRTIG